MLDKCKDSSYSIKEEQMITSIAYWQHVENFLWVNFDYI